MELEDFGYLPKFPELSRVYWEQKWVLMELQKSQKNGQWTQEEQNHIALIKNIPMTFLYYATPYTVFYYSDLKN